jgi:uncharacterized membrane protein
VERHLQDDGPLVEERRVKAQERVRRTVVVAGTASLFVPAILIMIFAVVLAVAGLPMVVPALAALLAVVFAAAAWSRL